MALHIGRLVLGTMTFGGQTEHAGAHRMIDHAIENGVNFFDTANGEQSLENAKGVSPDAEQAQAMRIFPRHISSCQRDMGSSS